jgi:hypothetical protein
MTKSRQRKPRPRGGETVLGIKAKADQTLGVAAAALPQMIVEVSPGATAAAAALAARVKTGEAIEANREDTSLSIRIICK